MMALDRGANVDRMRDGQNALMAASRNGHVNCVHYLLSNDAQADVDRADKYEWTALMFASNYGHVECVRALLDKADVDRATKNGYTALMLASSGGLAALVTASYNGHIECVRTLLDAGATDKEGIALMKASRTGNVQVMKLLMEKFPPQNLAMATLQWSTVSCCSQVQMGDALFSQAQAVFVTKLAELA
jgi:ankyrin repeat protein